GPLGLGRAPFATRSAGRRRAREPEPGPARRGVQPRSLVAERRPGVRRPRGGGDMSRRRRAKLAGGGSELSAAEGGTTSGRRPMTATPLYSGKVRDVYDAGDDRLLFVASDRMSAFDVVMAEPNPDKVRVLNAISAFWFDATGDIAPNHMVSIDEGDFPDIGIGDLTGRSM